MPMVSSIWAMRGMPRLVTVRTWVSPRWNRPVPWAVGRMPTSALSGRRSVGPRPSMRLPSSTTRFDHHDCDVAIDVAAGDDELEGRLVARLVRGMRRPLALGRPCDAHSADGSFEGDARNHQRRGRGVDGHDVVRVLLVSGEDGA